MSYFSRLAVFLLLLLACSACGQKGDLYLPVEHEPETVDADEAS